MLVAVALLGVCCVPALGATHAGELLGIGSGGHGELGPNAAAPENTSAVEVVLPGQVGGVSLIAAGDSFSLVTTTGGQLFGFGENEFGEAGVPGLENVQPPLTVSLPGASAAPSVLDAGIVTGFAGTAGGQLFSWGSNEGGMLGRGTGTEKRVDPGPVTLPGEAGGIASVGAGGHYTLVATTSGQLFSFGENKFGQLGRATNAGKEIPNPTPALVPVAGPVAQVAAGYDFGLALTSGGNLYTFGRDDVGQLGTGEPPEPNENPNPTPELVSFPPGAGPVTQIAAGDFTAYALTASGRLFGWGEGFEHDELAFEEDEPVWTPREITLPGASAPIVRIGAGEESAYALTANGVLFGWGGSEDGQLGEAQLSKFVNPTPTPIPLPAGTTVDTISSGCCDKHVLMLVADLGVGGTLPAALLGVHYSASLPFSGGTAPYTFSASGLPPGLGIDASTGAISGTPSAVGSFGPTFTVRDAYGIVASAAVPLTVQPRLAIGCECTVVNLVARARAALLAALGVHGKSAKLGQLLRHGYTVKFTAPAAGKATIQWYFVPKGAHVSKKGKPKPVLVASGSASFAKAGTQKLTIRLTAAGRARLAHAHHVKLTAKGTFKVAGGGTATAIKGLALSR